ncbi:hypothetical protein HK104_003737 [Borealophlyctis nickersoniae]|nr:hypothetical protein HK104_003737 [Borealophlyctis nickersoniae]
MNNPGYKKTLMGRHRVIPPTSVTYPLIDRLPPHHAHRSLWPQDLVQSVSFKEASGSFDYSGHYYQQRFERLDEHDHVPTVKQYLKAGAEKGGVSVSLVESVASQLGITDLLDVMFMKLSNGQVRRTRIARALLTKPEILVLDEPFMGLDVENRSEVADILGSVASQGSTRIILLLRPQDEIPKWITHILELEKGMSVRWQGARNEWMGAETHRLEGVNKIEELKKGRRDSGSSETEVVVELRNVNVAFEDKPILSDVSWTVHKGERWALMGHNGSGKSTLLSLLLGDNQQAYCNHVALFGMRRGRGVTIWDIKSQTGYLSPELHMYFSKPYTGRQTASTGFSDVLVLRPTTPAQDETITTLFSEFNATSLLDRPFRQMSTGEQRLVLLIRALVKRPPLLVLDEPFQGMDDDMVRVCKRWLDERLGRDQTLVFVTHHQEEIPGCVDRLIKLEAGKVVELV